MISCFQLKPYVKCFFQTCLKGFKLKTLVVEPKTTQPVEPDKESVDRQLNRSRSRLTPNSTGQMVWTVTGRPPPQSVEGCKKPYLSSRMVVQPDEEPVKV